MNWRSSFLMLVLAACTPDPRGNGDVDQTLTTQAVAAAIASVNGSDNYRILAVCGPAIGKARFADAKEGKWIDDGITDGRLVFVVSQDNVNDLYFRDAAGGFFSSLAEGAEIRRSTKASSDSWVIFYPNTGVAETHVLSGGAELIDHWTNNKPVSLGGASLKAFVSICRRP